MTEQSRPARVDRTEQAAALAGLGFGPPFVSGGGLFGGVELAACLTCGAAVPLLPLVEGQAHPLDLHVAFHEEHTR